MRHLVLLFCGLFSSLFANPFKFEGVFPDCVNKRLELIAHYLPYNPTVLLPNSNKENLAECEKYWPCGKVLHTREPNIPIQFLWIDFDHSELLFLKQHSDLLKDVQVIYLSTHQRGDKNTNYMLVKRFLERNQFKRLSHWYLEQGNGNAIFLRSDIYDCAVDTLNQAPENFTETCDFYPNKIDQFLRKAGAKECHHTLDSIDFIYMINLDERPEKFAKSSEYLNPYGIYPYRFSAVNGWKIAHEDLPKIGLQLRARNSQKKFMATVYREVNDREYMSNELVQEDQTCYFALGMSRGAIGIYLSHLSVVQDAFDSGYQTIWVMEDDIKVLADPLKIPSLIKKLDQFDPDWDILFTDTDQTDANNNYVPCRSVALRPNYAIEPISNFLEKFYSISYDLSRVGMRYGAYSMIIRRSGMEKILAHAKTYSIFLPYDMDFWLIPSMRMYRLNYDLISHDHKAISDNSLPNYLKKGL